VPIAPSRRARSGHTAARTPNPSARRADAAPGRRTSEGPGRQHAEPDIDPAIEKLPLRGCPKALNKLFECPAEPVTLVVTREAIRELARAMRDRTGNLPPLPGIFPDYSEPIVRNQPEGRELAMDAGACHRRFSR
jgi:hypothetical protein